MTLISCLSNMDSCRGNKQCQVTSVVLKKAMTDKATKHSSKWLKKKYIYGSIPGWVYNGTIRD